MKFLTMSTAICMSLENKTGILYGLPKIHKCDVPLRPILSAIGTAGYNLAKFFVPLLSAFTTNHFSIKDSFSFATEISSLPDSNSYFIASFDIKSLFTNIPLEEAVSIATENYFNINRPSRNFTPKLLPSITWIRGLHNHRGLVKLKLY